MGSTASFSTKLASKVWIKVGMLCETNPTLSFNEIVARELAAAGVSAPPLTLSAA